LLGLALLWLSRFAVIQDGFLQGGLKNPPQPYPLPVTVARMNADHNMGQFWSALGVSPRPAFSVTATIAMQPFDQAEQYPVVRTVEVDQASLVDPVLTGRVLNQALAPVAGAKVTVVEAQRAATVGPTGGFAFSGLDFGRYTLLVQVVNRPDVQAPVAYEINGQVHNVILPGP
jgi:hypothetical protein